MEAAPAGDLVHVPGPEWHAVEMLFSVGHLSLDDQEALARRHGTRRLRGAWGPGRRVSGLSVLGIETVRSLERDRTKTTLAALAAVFLWLLVAFRSRRWAPLALLPVVTAVGASTLAIYVLGVTVSALGALSGPLVIAVSTEFSVLILERYDEERRRGRSPEEAVATASLSIGRAFTASGLTIAGGFAALALSGFPLLSSFGTVVAVNIIAAMLCALVILPPLLRHAGTIRSPVGRPGDTCAPAARVRPRFDARDDMTSRTRETSRGVFRRPGIALSRLCSVASRTSSTCRCSSVTPPSSDSTYRRSPA